MHNVTLQIHNHLYVHQSVLYANAPFSKPDPSPSLAIHRQWHEARCVYNDLLQPAYMALSSYRSVLIGATFHMPTLSVNFVSSFIVMDAMTRMHHQPVFISTATGSLLRLLQVSEQLLHYIVS